MTLFEEMKVTNDYRSEFWFHVADQKEIPIYGVVDRSIDIAELETVVDSLPETEDEQREFLITILKNNPNAIDFLRAFVGVSDKRMYLELSYIFGKKISEIDDTLNVLGYSIYDLKKHNIPFFKRLLARGDDSSSIAASIIADYLLSKGILSILQALKSLDKAQLPVFVDSLILPKEVQQEETKRRGHGAEQQFAILLNSLGVSFIPEGKHINPMSSQDPNVDKTTFQLAPRNEDTTWSFDVIIKDNSGEFIAFTQGLVHTSDPGQYGVNKSGETVTVKKDLQKHNEQRGTHAELWGLVDGVGFIENPNNTIFKMLAAFDTFIQMKSMYKAALRLHKLGVVKLKAIRFDMDFYTEEDANAMFEKYGSEDIVKVTDMSIPAGKGIPAGKAWIYV